MNPDPTQDPPRGAAGVRSWPVRAGRVVREVAAWPRRTSRRVAWLYLVFALIAMVSFALVAIGASSRPAPLRLAGLAAVLLLVVLWAGQYRTGPWPWGAPVEALAILVVGGALERPSQAVVAAFGSVVVHAVNMSLPRLVVLAVAVCAAVVVGSVVWVQPLGARLLEPVLWQTPLVALVASLNYALGQVLRDQERSADRERALATAGPKLAEADDPAVVYAAALDCLLDLLERRPDLRVAVWTGEDVLVARAAAGDRAEDLIGKELPGDLGPAREALLEPDPAVRPAVQIPPGAGVGWTSKPGVVTVTLPMTSAPRTIISVAADQPVPEETHGAISALASLTALALESIARTDDLQSREARFRALVQNSSDAITVIGQDTTVTYASPSVHSVFGVQGSALEGRRLEELVHPEDRPKLVAFMRRVARPGRTVPLSARMRHADGTWLEIDSLGTNALHLPAVGGIVLNSRDVSERKALERQLSVRAYYDSLTHLANRALLRLQIRRGLTRADRSGRHLAVLMIDLDGFKMLNDSLGHLAGDEVLVAVAERIRACVRPHDTPARLGGDEFAVLLEDLDGPSPAVGVARRVISQLDRPIQTSAGREVFARASIGVALSGPEARTPDDLIRNADVAMYMAKADGAGGYRKFESDMHAAVTERIGLETDLHRAVERDELVVHYQPVVRLADRTIVGVEALVRWDHPERGLLAPQRFIPVAEDTGVIVAVGAWVLRTAARQVWRWQQSYRLPKPMAVAVNVSARQLQQADLAGQLRSVLRDTGLEGPQLVLELTESLLVQYTEASIATLESLKELGLRLAIDDFGTGFSSLAYLRRFPFDVLKIDRSFVRGVDEPDSDDAALAHAIVQIGHALGLDPLAEGIETAAQLAAMKELGCTFGQGFHLAPPLPADELERVLAAAARNRGKLDPSAGIS
jgi:diguanylate cyclase (GGDEF)-like protein/PAS domain S-box-containing protein